jgi:hypothetical protein
MSQDFKDGDIIFHTSKSSQSKMIQEVTESNLTHCGIIFFQNGKPFVFEAVQPVKITPLKDWINRGVGGKYIVSRVKTPLNKPQISQMYGYAKKQLGKSSELVYKVFATGNVYVATPKKFSDYNLESKIVKDAINSRYGNSINVNEKVVTPVDIYKSSSVKTIFNNY